DVGELLAVYGVNDPRHVIWLVWAAIAGCTSTRASLRFLRMFGTLYCLDGALYFFAGVDSLAAVFGTFCPAPLTPWERILVSSPHLALGGLAAFVGFGLTYADGEMAALVGSAASRHRIVP